MRTTFTQKSLLTLALACGVTASSGCDVSESSVASAQDDVIEEQRETVEARREGAENVRAKEKQLADARHTVNRPSYDADIVQDNRDQIADAKQELDEAKRDAAEGIMEEEKETAEAKERADKMARELEVTEARDAYVAKMNAKLESIDEKIAGMEENANDLEGLEQEKAEADIEKVETKRENLSNALNQLTAVDVMQWQTKKPAVDRAHESFQSTTN